MRSPGQRPGRVWYRREPGEATRSVWQWRMIVKYLTQCGPGGVAELGKTPPTGGSFSKQGFTGGPLVGPEAKRF